MQYVVCQVVIVLIGMPRKENQIVSPLTLFHGAVAVEWWTLALTVAAMVPSLACPLWEQPLYPYVGIVVGEEDTLMCDKSVTQGLVRTAGRQDPEKS